MELEDRYPKCQAYPPAPNWYSSGATTIIEPHFFLYATRNLIVILDLKSLKYFNSFAVSPERINVIDAHNVFCFAGGVDKIVYVWNIFSNTLTTSHSEHKNEITAIKSFRNGTVVISGDKSGKIVVTEPFGENATIVTKVKAEVTCISTVTYNNVDYAAIGYANGLIFIEEITENLDMKTVYQFASDNDPIQSVDWQKKTSATQWPLLAFSTKRLKSVIIYDIPSQKKFTSIRIPHPPSVATDKQQSAVWLELSWSPCEGNRLYLTGYLGAILAFDVTPSGARPYNSGRMDKHSRIVFSLNWYNQGRRCITTSLDNQVIKWDVNRGKCLQVMKTPNAFAYALDMSPCTTKQLAIGMGDNSLKLWNFQKSESVMPNQENHNYYTAQVIWKHLYGKILRMACHPSIQGLLAYANEFGRVGIYDTLNNSNIVFKTNQKLMECPLIAWGPDMSLALSNASMSDTLITCCTNGAIYVYDSHNEEADPILLNDFLDQKNPSWADSLKYKHGFRRTSMIVKENFIAFGHMDGVVEVYSLSTFKLLYTSIFHRKTVMSMDWKDNYLATGCEQGVIAIHDLTNKIKDVPDTVVPEVSVYKSINQHKGAITTLKWTHEPKKYILASGSRDNLVAVWDMDQLVSIFNHHRSSLLSICWNREDYKNLFTSGEDRFIYQWNYTDYENSGPIDTSICLFEKESSQMIKQNRKRPTTNDVKPNEPKKAKTKANEVISESEKSERTTSQLNKGKKCLRIANIMFEGKVEATIKEIRHRELTEKEVEDPTTARYFNIFEHDENNNVYELIFGDKEDSLNLAAIEEKSIQEYSDTQTTSQETLCRFDKQLAMNLILSQVDTLFSDSKDNLTDWITLAMSPQAGKCVWIDLMKKQGKKMEKARKYHLAASCYIACSHIYEAIEIYQKHDLFREAIILAKSRVPLDKKLLSDIFLKWANDLQYKEDHAMAAICFLLSNAPGSVNNAINMLQKTNKEEGLFFATCLSHASGNSMNVQQWKNKLKERFSKKK